MADLAVGAGQACVRMVDRRVYCWGSNRLGSVGVRGRSGQHHKIPVRVANASAERILLVGTRTCFEPPEGGLFCWGGRMRDEDADPRPLAGVPNGRLVSAEGTACAITDDGAATCWGENLNGRLSPGDEAAVGETAGSDQPPKALAVGAPVTSVAMGRRHGCALGRDRRVRCWGLNNYGQLGFAPHQLGRRAAPAVLEGLDDVAEIASGYFHSCALRGDGSVWCWGRGDDGELGTGEALEKSHDDERFAATPTQVKGLDEVAHIYAASSQTCAATKKRALYCWGKNADGQLGDGTTRNRFTPVRVVDIEDVTQVSIGHATACALTLSGDVYCWGANDDGALGNGGAEASARPVKVKLPR